MLLLACLLVAGAAARDVTDEEYARFPRLFHLDDYETCLAQPDGLYCLGTFHITPAKLPDPDYDLLKEYSNDRNNFNRTLVHRGYCVSARCGAGAGAGARAGGGVRRFERCAARWGRARRLRVRLAPAAAHYCRSHAQHYAAAHSPAPLDVAHRVWLAAVLAFLLFNAVGTAYDLIWHDDTKIATAISSSLGTRMSMSPESKLLVCWSVRSNWRRLTATYEDGDPRLTALLPVQGLRVLLLILIMMTHAGCIHVMSYLHNPRFIEKMTRHPILMLFLNGTSIVQLFVMISSFLLAYNLLIISKDHQLSLKHLPYCIIKRVARIAPVYLLVVGYAATWWGGLREGPLWASLVGAESAVCRRKFWAHALFVNNLVEPQDVCLVQTWFIAVDMQLHAVGAALTLRLAAGGARRAARVLAALGAAACALTAALAYLFAWQPLVSFATPENMRTMYRDVPSFSHLYMSPWGSLPACLAGLLLAHLHHLRQERAARPASPAGPAPPQRWAAACQLAAPLIVAWIAGGAWARGAGGRAGAALYAALERPVLAALGALGLYGMFNGHAGALRGALAWRGWHAMGRLSLAVLMVHWCLNLMVAAARPLPAHSSAVDVGVDFLATATSSYLVAVPLTLLVEMPVYRFVSALIF